MPRWLAFLILPVGTDDAVSPSLAARPAVARERAAVALGRGSNRMLPKRASCRSHDWLVDRRSLERLGAWSFVTPNCIHERRCAELNWRKHSTKCLDGSPPSLVAGLIVRYAL